MKKPFIYLDNASTTPIDKDIIEIMNMFLSPEYANPSSIHTPGRNAKNALEKARIKVAQAINALPEEIYFTGGGTEADNLAVFGSQRKNFKNHNITSTIEHKAILDPIKKLEGTGSTSTYIPVSKEGTVSIDDIKNGITTQTTLVSIMYVNNEIGTVQPIAEIGNEINKIKKNGYPIFHTDACQAPSYMPIDVRKLGVDMMTLNGSKIYGPKGVGALFVKKGTSITGHIIGGGQEKNIRSGTENVSAIVGFATALERSVNEREVIVKKITELRDYCIDELFRTIPEISLNGSRDERVANNINISVPGVEGESVLLSLDEEGIFASTGSACASKNLTPSHVLLALGIDIEKAHGTIRFTLGKHTKKEDIDFLMSVFPGIIKRLQSLSPTSISKL